MKIRIKLLVFALVLVLALPVFALISNAADTETTLIDLSTEWRYLDTNVDPALTLPSLTDWTNPGFNDSSWKRASGTFGSKNGALGSISGCGTPTVLLNLYKDGISGDVIPTYFFRTTFTVDDLSKISTLNFDMKADDAIIVYINGKVVKDSRSQKPSAASTTNMYYADMTSADQSFWLDAYAISEALVEGTNTLAVELHNNQKASSDIYFGLTSLTASTEKNAATFFTNVVLTVGADVTERNITWYSTDSIGGAVYYAPKSKMENGQFPSTASVSYTTATAATNKPGYYSHKATVSGLSPDTDYVYRLYVNGHYSDIHYFSTDSLGDFEFVFVGDPQISTQKHSTSWIDTLTKIKESLGTNLLVSAGDQVTTPDSEEQYGYLLVEEISGITFAPTIGPSHDSQSVAFTEHFALPNVSDKYGVNETGANYWYTYNSALFMHLNMSDTSAATNGEHKAFMKETIAANPDAKWTFVILHNALFSAGDHSSPEYKYFETEIGKYREVLAPVLTELDIDVVLSGHDHIYVRSKIMNGATPTDDVETDGYISEPSGTLHIAASSSTGSKFYPNSVPDAYYAAVINDEQRKSAILFSVTDNSITFKSYFLDDMSVFDELTVYKKPHVHTPKSIDANDPTCDKKGNEQYWQCTECSAYFSDEACTTPTTPDAQASDALGHDYSSATCSAPKICQREGCGKTLGKPKDHVWREPTCTDPYTCENCDATDGEPLGHKYANACSTTCTRCKDVRAPSDHVDENKDHVCDACSAKLENDGAPIGLIIGISAVALVAIAAVVAVLIIKKRKH